MLFKENKSVFNIKDIGLIHQFEDIKVSHYRCWYLSDLFMMAAES
jgi:hypothetical protein